MNNPQILATPAGVSPIEYFLFDSGQEVAAYTGKMDIDGDGPNGNPYGDPTWQGQTSLQLNGQSIDSTQVAGVVAHPSIISGTRGIVLGCLVLVGYNGQWFIAVCYDKGPLDKAGEGSVKLAQNAGIPSSPINGGASSGVTYLFFPGIPCPGFTLQAS